MRKIFVFTVLFCTLSLLTVAQHTTSDQAITKAMQLVSQEDDEKAIKILKKTINDDPTYAPLHIFLGEIYFNKKDFGNSIAYYEKGINIDSNYDMNAYYRLGVMYKQIDNYEQSKKYFSYYIHNQTKKEYKFRVEQCKYNIKCIDFILEQLQTKKDILPINLGTNINDTVYQYLPTLTIDNQLYFTQRENDQEDFYFASSKQEQMQNTDGVLLQSFWNKKQKLPFPLNTNANEGAASISPDGRYLYFAKCNTKDGFGSCDIYRRKRIGDSWSEAQNLGINVNSSAWESQPSIASDGRTLFFVSNREGGFGGSDIWYTYLRDDSTWSKAKNCGNIINSGGNEMSPFIHPSNSTLYFSSDSLVGIGGQDIYYSKIINGKFQKPINIGYPINTKADETCLVVSASGKFAIYAKDNPPNKMDLYAFEMEDEKKPTKVICLRGKVFYDDSKIGNEAIFEIRNLHTNKLITSTTSDKISDTYTLALVTQEDYAMSVTCSGYLLYSENFSIKDDKDIIDKDYIDKDIRMQSIKEGKSVILKNIFFATNSFELKEESNVELNTLLKLMNTNPNISVEIAGHTDNTGKEEYNLILSQKRANEVKKWLVDKGIDTNKLSTKGYGMQKPIADNSTEDGRRQNRRTEFKILKVK